MSVFGGRFSCNVSSFFYIKLFLRARLKNRNARKWRNYQGTQSTLSRYTIRIIKVHNPHYQGTQSALSRYTIRIIKVHNPHYQLIKAHNPLYQGTQSTLSERYIRSTLHYRANANQPLTLLAYLNVSLMWGLTHISLKREIGKIVCL